MDNQTKDLSSQLPALSEALQRWQLPDDLDISAPIELDLAGELLRYGFRIGNYGLLIDADTTSEVMEPLPTFRMPNTIAELLGLINLRGNLVPIYDLHRILGLTSDNPQRMMLVLGESERSVGLMIDGLPQAAHLNHPLATPSTLPSALGAYVSQAYQDANITWLEFQHHSFFQDLAARAG